MKDANSGLKSEGGFTRFVHKFNHNDVMSSPTTSSGSYQQQAQKIKIPKGIAGKIRIEYTKAREGSVRMVSFPRVRVQQRGRAILDAARAYKQ